MKMIRLRNPRCIKDRRRLLCIISKINEFLKEENLSPTTSTLWTITHTSVITWTDPWTSAYCFHTWLANRGASTTWTRAYSCTSWTSANWTTWWSTNRSTYWAYWSSNRTTYWGSNWWTHSHWGTNPYRTGANWTWTTGSDRPREWDSLTQRNCTNESNYRRGNLLRKLGFTSWSHYRPCWTSQFIRTHHTTFSGTQRLDWNIWSICPSIATTWWTNYPIVGKIRRIWRQIIRRNRLNSSFNLEYLRKRTMLHVILRRHRLRLCWYYRHRRKPTTPCLEWNSTLGCRITLRLLCEHH